jgi:hypothetical protein
MTEALWVLVGFAAGAVVAFVGILAGVRLGMRACGREPAPLFGKPREVKEETAG